jgi:MFS family permease
MAATARAAVERPLDGLNFFLADVRDGLGPYLAIYLLAVQHWDAASIGVVMTIGGLAGLLTQTPAGALIDATRAKRAVVIVAAVLVTACSLILPLMPSFWPVALTQIVTGAAGSIFAPAIAAITLGAVGPKAFTPRIGRNESFNHAGNAVAAAFAGVFSYGFGPIAVFWLMAGMAIASIVATLSLPAAAIDHDVARGLDARAEPGEADHLSGFRMVLTSRPLLVFTAASFLFHLANGAMLPLVGQKLALLDRSLATPLVSACVVAAQLVMMPMAMLAGAKADGWGRKALLLAGFAILPIRGVLYTVSNDMAWLVGVQLLDGVGAGLFGALLPLIVHDLTKGTGRFNVSLGAVSTAFGAGAALSPSLAGFVVEGAGYGAAFLTLAAIAALAFLVLLMLMPETGPSKVRSPLVTAPALPT